MLTDVDEIYSTKGKRVTHVDLKKGRPSNETLLSLIAGTDGQPAGSYAEGGQNTAGWV